MKAESRLEKGYKKIIDFIIDKEEMEDYRKKAFTKLKRNAKINGFRKGKAPDSIIKSRYGSSIETDAVNDAINDNYSKYLVENKIYPLAEAAIEDLDIKEGELKFTAIMEVHPEFELKEYTGITVEHEKDIVKDEEINTVLNEILDKHASSKEVNEPVTKGHLVELSIRPFAGEDAKWEKKTVEAGKNPEDQVDNEIMGLSKGEIKKINWNMPEMNGVGIDIEIRIDKVSEKILPELNDEFAKTYDSKYSGLDEMKKDIKKDLEENKKNMSDNAVYDKIARQIIEKHDNFEVPPSILEKYVESLIDNAKKSYGDKIDTETLKNLYGKDAEQGLKWEYIRQRIIAEKKLEADENDIEQKMKEISEKSNIDIEKVKKYYSPAEKKKMLKDEIKDRKLRDHLIKNNTVNRTEPSEDDKDVKETE